LVILLPNFFFFFNLAPQIATAGSNREHEDNLKDLCRATT
jgi:hypothetical protein